MIPIENFKAHLETISKNDWLTLFELIPEIEKTGSFGEFVFDEKEDNIQILPYCTWSEIVSRFVSISYKLNIIPVFEWMNWVEGKNVLNSKTEQSFDDFDEITLCKFIGAIIRADRFNEGYLVSQFKNHTILKILISLKHKILKGS